MTYNPEIHHRRSIRIQNHDYSQEGAYFVTMCTHQRECLFGEIVDGVMVLNQFGAIAQNEWIQSQKIRTEITMGEYIVMPNHIHGIVQICNVGANGCSPYLDRSPESIDRNHNEQSNNHNLHESIDDLSDLTGANRRSPLQRTNMGSKTLSSLIAGFKSTVTKQINQIRNVHGIPIWQRNYWERIIRNESELQRTSEYIRNNPLKWQEDDLHIS